jgi:hypothetical protein
VLFSSVGAADVGTTCVYDADTGTTTVTLAPLVNYLNGQKARVELSSSSTGIVNPSLPGDYPILIQTKVG